MSADEAGHQDADLGLDPDAAADPSRRRAIFAGIGAIVLIVVLVAWRHLSGAPAAGDATAQAPAITVIVPEWARLTGTVTARGFSTSADLARPARRVGAVSVDVKVWRTIAVFGAYARDLEVEATGAASSRYRASDTVLAGVRLGLVFSGGQGGRTGHASSAR